VYVGSFNSEAPINEKVNPYGKPLFEAEQKQVRRPAERARRGGARPAALHAQPCKAVPASPGGWRVCY
jgi:hypothetical protein